MNAISQELESGADSDRYMVTASDLVRHFGLWQDRAARAPVYILHRGRPRHVLTSIEVMNALCAPHDQAVSAAEDASVGALLDFTGDIILIADAALRIAALSLPARSFFGGEARPGVALDRLVAPAMTPLLIDAVQRVAASGTSESLELASIRYPERRLDATIAPHASGVAIKLKDVTLADDVAAARARRLGEDEAVIAAGGMAAATINPRGYLDSASASLCAMTGLGPQSLTSVRFVSLVEIGSRAALGDAIEAVLAGRGATGLGAVLLVNRAAPVAVRIGLGAIRRGTAIIGVAVMIARDVDGLREP